MKKFEFRNGKKTEEVTGVVGVKKTKYKKYDDLYEKLSMDHTIGWLPARVEEASPRMLPFSLVK